MDVSSLATQAVIALSILLVLWYFVGTMWNRSRSLEVLAWLRETVRPLGGEGRLRWLGRSAFVITLENTISPFQNVSVVAFLQPREALPVWLFNFLRGEGDLLILQAQLRKDPRWELEIADPRTRLGREALKQVSPWSREDRPPWQIAYRSPQALQFAQALLGLLSPQDVLRLGVRKSASAGHLSMGLNLPPLTPLEGEALLSLLQRLEGTITSSA